MDGLDPDYLLNGNYEIQHWFSVMQNSLSMRERWICSVFSELNFLQMCSWACWSKTIGFATRMSHKEYKVAKRHSYMDWLHCMILIRQASMSGNKDCLVADFKLLLLCMFSAHVNKMDSVLFGDALAYTEGWLMGTECTSCLISNLLRINAIAPGNSTIIRPFFRHFQHDESRLGLSVSQDNVLCIIYPHGYVESATQLFVLETFGDHLFHVYDYRNYLIVGRLNLESYGSFNINVSGAVIVALHSIMNGNYQHFKLLYRKGSNEGLRLWIMQSFHEEALADEVSAWLPVAVKGVNDILRQLPQFANMMLYIKKWFITFKIDNYYELFIIFFFINSLKLISKIYASFL